MNLKKIWNVCLMTLGAFIYAVAVSLFLDPNNLAPGGVTGIAIILNRLSNLSTGTWIMMINIPILSIGMWKFGFRFLISTIYCTVIISVFTDGLNHIPRATEDPILAALAGGVLMALGMGFVFKAGATSGGTDIIVKLLRRKFPHIKTGLLFMSLDILVVTASALTFRNLDRALYAGITVFIASYVLDMVLYGRDEAKLLYIISDSSEVIARRLLEELNIGVTYMDGHGAYSGKKKRVLLCAVKKMLSPKVEEIVKKEDMNAFMIITSATEVFGEGYKSYYSERL